jgi:hypothetical protein
VICGKPRKIKFAVNFHNIGPMAMKNSYDHIHGGLGVIFRTQGGAAGLPAPARDGGKAARLTLWIPSPAHCTLRR